MRVRVGNENNYCGGGALRRDGVYKRLDRLQGLIVRKVVCSLVLAASDGGRDGKAVSSGLVAVSAHSLEEFHLAGVLASSFATPPTARLVAQAALLAN